MRFKGLDLNLVVALDILLQERSVSRAAERLKLSQPAVSAALARLRDYFGDDLLVSIGRAMIPTAYAESLWPIARTLLAQADLLVDTSATFDPATSQRRFRVNASDYTQTVLISPVLRRLQRSAPHISMDVGPTGPMSLAEFEAGEIDCIISPEQYVSLSHPSRPLFEEQHVVVGWRGNPAMAAPLDLDGFLALGHVAVSIGSGRELSFAERHLLPYRERRRVEVTTSTFSGVPLMLPQTLRIAVLQERLAATFCAAFDLVMQPLPFAMPPLREMVQYHSGRANDPGIAWLVGAFESYAAEGSPG
ncbi:LysR family transcriptional regulator [Sphingomonas metalli]|uniref:LysR family transcriptional regulator n=1 Tax=Sphingomonas metalli TaxID=1779358 RepID=A0A916TD69_9SPHN|nr:LysR family transcriptional regulator [Sphingomonas metalli]GGB38134.1 LysR family transcriptional regulator [Sphingomonas metalli]